MAATIRCDVAIAGAGVKIGRHDNGQPTTARTIRREIDVAEIDALRAQVEAGAWLVLAPSCTDTMHGFNRVRFSAAARALESQCYVAVTPTVGLAPWSAALDVNRGFAAVFPPPPLAVPTPTAMS